MQTRSIGRARLAVQSAAQEPFSPSRSEARLSSDSRSSIPSAAQQIAGPTSAVVNDDDARSRKFRLFTMPPSSLSVVPGASYHSIRILYYHFAPRRTIKIVTDEDLMADRRLRLGAFMRPVGIDTGWWRYPGTYSDANFNFPHLKGFAQTLERGKFDAFFMADHLAVLNMPIKALKRSATVTSFEPFTLLSALAGRDRTDRPDCDRRPRRLMSPIISLAASRRSITSVAAARAGTS